MTIRHRAEYEHDRQVATPCEQCGGSGWVHGHRCACQEAEDDASDRRRRFQVQNNALGGPRTRPKEAGQG